MIGTQRAINVALCFIMYYFSHAERLYCLWIMFLMVDMPKAKNYI